ncbi:MAG: hypothetical protein V4603_09575, partial [Pseudomonadota bacterium]
MLPDNLRQRVAQYGDIQLSSQVQQQPTVVESTVVRLHFTEPQTLLTLTGGKTLTLILRNRNCTPNRSRTRSSTRVSASESPPLRKKCPSSLTACVPSTSRQHCMTTGSNTSSADRATAVFMPPPVARTTPRPCHNRAAIRARCVG